MGKPMPIELRVNGEPRKALVEPRKLLSDFLREDLQLTGTNVGCEHGICGACSVIMDGRLVRSCLTLAVQARSAEIMTIEGLARDGKIHPIQEAFYEKYGAQCGFCTPGQVLTAYALLTENLNATEDEMREALSGVLCRCTGYYHILESVKAAAVKMKAAPPPEPARKR